MQTLKRSCSTYVCVCVCVCVCIYIHLYTHTHTHTYIHTYIHKGKQAQTLKSTFSFRTASGEEKTVTAVTKEFKKGRNWELFLHNEYLALARLSRTRGCPPTIPKVCLKCALDVP